MIRPCPEPGCLKQVRARGRHAGGHEFLKKHCICRVDTKPRLQVRYPKGRGNGLEYWRCQACKRLEFGMPPNLLLLGIVGSTAYGLDHTGSDLDYLGIFQEPTRNLVGITQRLPETIVSHDPDRALHEVGKFFRLALAGNPTVNELLWLDHYENMTDSGVEILRIRESFLSDKMRKTYGGYVLQQAQRIERGKVKSNQKKRIEKHGRHCFRLLIQGCGAIKHGRLIVRLSPEERELCISMGRLAVDSPEAFHDAVQRELIEFDETPSVLPPQPDASRVDGLLLQLRNDGSLRDDGAGAGGA